VRTLVDGLVDAGSHSVVWDGRDDRGRSAGTGVYFVRMAGAGAAGAEQVRTVRVMLLR
jgi:flagellar hook assembly protein FlgD